MPSMIIRVPCASNCRSSGVWGLHMRLHMGTCSSLSSGPIGTVENRCAEGALGSFGGHPTPP